MAHRVTGATVAPPDLEPDPGYDATFGYDLDRLLSVGVPDTEPDDLDDFWTGVKGEADAVDSLPELGEWHPHGERHQVAAIAFTSLDGVRIGGWLVRPNGAVTRGLVVSHGYGGRQAPDGWLPDGAAAIYPVARGLPTRSLTAGFGETSETHVLTGIASPRTYSHVGSTADQWIAGRELRALLPDVDRLDFVGGSFGGGIGVFTLAYDDTFAAGVLEVPSFGHHPLRLTMPCRGSGEAVRRYWLDHPEVVETLRYVDAATVAARVRQPVLVLAALADPSVPPPGQFAVANAGAGPTHVHVLPAGHAEYRGSVEAIAERDEIAQAFLR
jgi:cephalosporin-C deacetylase